MSELPQEGVTEYDDELRKARKVIKKEKRERAIEVLKRCLEYAKSKMQFKGDDLKKYLRDLPEDDIYEVRWAMHYAKNREKFTMLEHKSILYIRAITQKWLRKEYDLVKSEVLANDDAYRRSKQGGRIYEKGEKQPCEICGKVLRDPTNASHVNSPFHQDALKVIERLKYANNEA